MRSVESGRPRRGYTLRFDVPRQPPQTASRRVQASALSPRWLRPRPNLQPPRSEPQAKDKLVRVVDEHLLERRVNLIHR
jgi:hypothetical protein